MISNRNRIYIIAQLILLTLVLSFVALAAGEVDTSFHAGLTYAPETGNGRNILRQPDGKYLISGFFRAINGIPNTYVTRLNADGTPDLNFKAPTLQENNSVESIEIALQSNGKILIGGNFTTLGSQPYSYFARLNPDGSLDTTFPHLFSAAKGNVSISKIHVFPDDSFLIGGGFTVSSAGGNRRSLARLSADGIVDPSFNYTHEWYVLSFDVQPDGKLVVAYMVFVFQTRFPNINRFNSDGSVDSSFDNFSTPANSTISDIKCLPDGKILFGGNFESVRNDFNRKRLFRANSDGTIDETFNVVTVLQDGGVLKIVPDPSGKIYISGSFGGRMYRLNSDGTGDTSFSFFSQTYGHVNDFLIQPDGKIIVLGEGVEDFIIRITSTGNQDTTFPILRNTRPGTGLSVLVQPDNKILVAGPFTNVNGFSRPSFARFNADGTRDESFVGSSIGVTQIYDIDLQPDGKILFAGVLGAVGRWRTNGTIELSFTDTANYGAVKVLPDGKVLIGGPSLRRHNSNGTLDTTLATLTGSIYKMILQPDGKIIIVGNFTAVNGTTRNRIARLNPDGTIDTSFNPPGGANADIFSVALQTDGKFLIGGSFTAFNSDPGKQYLARLNSDGSIDASFAPVLNAPVLDLKIQSDGRILLGGSMSAVGGASRPGIARINADGTLDTTFNVGTGTNSTVWSIDQQSDGKIIYTGEFTVTNGIPTIGIGRLLNTNVAPKKLFDYDGDGKSDVSVFRASENKWYVLQSSNFVVIQTIFASTGDIPSPADFDGDGKTDLAVFRPSNGSWWYLSSINNAQISVQWGQAGDIPRPSDFDGDGKSDFVVYRPSNSVWYRFGSSGVTSILAFGIGEDKPLTGDFDGDGKSDPAIFRPSTGDWWYASSVSGQFISVHWGATGDVPVPADYDGDGRTDCAIYRPSNGGWFVLNSSNGSFNVQTFGLAEDKPISADYDGDGKADIAVFRPSTGTWYLLQTTAGFGALQFGISTDIPTESAFIP